MATGEGIIAEERAGDPDFTSPDLFADVEHELLPAARSDETGPSVPIVNDDEPVKR